VSDSSAGPADLLKQAQALHIQGRIDEAIATARRAIEADPAYVEAWMYLGTTLVTRKLDFAPGLAALEQALALSPEDPGVNYSLGWCYEFVAYRLEKQGRKPYRDPLQLYELAIEHLQHTIDLHPEQGLQDDAQDLMDSITRRI
jgi:tetratricopeptide (TPR) repeat protein